MANEYEIIDSSKIYHMNLFLNELEYRTSHLHSEFEILYIVKNPLELRLPKESYILNPDEAYIVNPNQVHQLEKVEGASTFICLQFSPALLKNIYPSLSHMRFKFTNLLESINGSEIRKTILTLARLWQDYENEKSIEITALLFHLIYLIIESVPYRVLSQKEKEEENANISRVSRLLEFIDQGYTHKINLSDFANAEGLTLSYLSHFVKNVLSVPFQDYVNFLRFNYARKLLTTGNMRITEAAYESGFSDPRYLTRTFMKYTGMNIREYRKIFSQNKNLESGLKVHMSAHSLERYYSRRKSIELIDEL